VWWFLCQVKPLGGCIPKLPVLDLSLGDHLFWECPYPGALPYTKRIPFEFMGYQTNIKSEWALGPWQHHKQYENKIPQCAPLPNFHPPMLSSILYPNWIVHVTRNNHSIVRDENEGRRISRHYEKWKSRQMAILLQFRNQGLSNDMKSLSKIFLKFFFLFFWIFNDNCFQYSIISEFKFKRYKTTLVSCLYAWPHTWRPITGMPIMPLGLMYALRVNVCS
jgi:hypothetical protein